MQHSQIQTIKFVLTSVFAAVGLFVFVTTGGTLTFFLVSLFVSMLITRTANVAYHRWLAHNYIQPGTFGRWFLLWTIVASQLADPVRYVIGHRLHHKYSDTENDPHDPKRGFFKCLLGNYNEVSGKNIPIRDILRQEDVMFVSKHYVTLYLANLIVFALISFHFFVLSFLLINLLAWVNITLFNYVAHGGKRINKPLNLPTWTAFLTGWTGEQLHKNHHDDPSNPNFGRISRFNFDITYIIMKTLFKTRTL